MLALSAAVLAAVLVYLNSLGGDFVWDDRKLIVNDPTIRSWRHLREVFSNDFFERIEDDVPYGYYRPLTTVSYLADFSVWGLRPFGYHLANLLLHAGCTLLAGWVLLRLGWTLWPATLAALLFAVHPIHTESVAWIAGRTDLLAFFFCATALLFHLTADGRGEGSKARAACRSLAVVAFVCGLLAKEMSVVLIGWIALVERINHKRSWRSTLSALVPYLALLGAYLVWRFLVIQIPLPGAPPEHRWPAVWLSMAPTVVRYLVWLLLPGDPNAYVQNPYVTGVLDARFVGSVAVLVALAVPCLRVVRTSERAALAAGMLALSFLPIVNLVRVAGPADMGNVMAERFLYFASFPFAALAGLVVAGALERTRGAPARRATLVAGIAVVLVAASLATVRRNRDWANELTFLTRTLEQSPTAVLLWGNLANYHLRAKQLDEAAAAIAHAAALDPRNYAVLSARVLWNVVGGHSVDAIPLQEEIVAHAGHGRASALNNLAYLYRTTGRDEAARAILDALIAEGHGYADVYFNRAEVARRQGQVDRARQDYRLALQNRPDDVQMGRALATLERESGALDAAESIYRHLLAIHRGDARLLNNLALIRHEQGDDAEALELLRQAAELHPDYVNGRINYAQLLERAGRSPEAAAQLEEAVRRAHGTELQQVAAKQLEALRASAAPPGAASIGRPRIDPPLHHD